MRFVDIHGDKEEHYEKVTEYARQCQENEQHLCEEQRIREWFSAELDNTNCLRIGSEDLIRYVVREVQILKVLFREFEGKTDKNVDTEQLWKDFLLYNLNLFAGYFILKEKRKQFILKFATKLLHFSEQEVLDFMENYPDYDRRYQRYMEDNFSLEKNTDRYFWKLIFQTGNAQQTFKFTKEYLRFIYFYVFYLYLKVYAGTDPNAWKRTLKQHKISLAELEKDLKSGKFLAADLKKMENPLYCSDRPEVLKGIQNSMKVILFCLTSEGRITEKEGELEMIEELYRQWKNGILTQEELRSIIPEEIRCEAYAGKLPDFRDYEADFLQTDEKIHYLDHTILYQGKSCNGEIQFQSYKGILIFTDRRIVFKGVDTLDLEYERISRIAEYDVLPEILEIRSLNRINYFQVPDIEAAYKILKLIANRKEGTSVDEKQVPLSYEELVDKADIRAYVFAFEYMLSGDLPRELREGLNGLNHKLVSLKKTTEQYPECKNAIYQFLHYYIPETVRLVREYQKYQNAGLTGKTADKVYEKVVTAVQALDRAVYQKITEIYQTAVRDTVAGAEALKEILGQDGYVDKRYSMDK